MSPEIAKRRILAALWRSPVLSILQTENLKRKASHFDWRRYKNQFYIIQAAQDACASYLRTANVSLRNKVELLHLKRLYYEAHLAVHEAILRIMKHAWRRMKRSLFRLHIFCLQKKGKKNGGRTREVPVFSFELKICCNFLFYAQNCPFGLF